MTTLVLGKAAEDMFQRRVVPVLEARGAICSDLPLRNLQRFLNDEPRLWAIDMKRPNPGAVCNVRFVGRAAPLVFDSRVTVRGLAQDFRGERVVRVKHVYGVSALCEPIEGYTSIEPSHETCRLLAITSREVTVVCDILPGQDCWIAVAAWANETLPIDILLQRPEKMWSCPEATFDTLPLIRDATTFATKCSECDGSGELDCEKCDASGRLPCRPCDARGDFQCSRCHGSGVFKPRKTCPKCDGSGNFVGRNGRVLDCNPCHGRGYFEQLDCNACSGSGRFQCRSCGGEGYVACRPCDGTGSIDCYRCRASGFLHVHFSTLDGLFTGSAKDDAGNRVYSVVAPRDVCLFSWETNQQIKITSGAARLLHQVIEATRGPRYCEPLVAARLEGHCRQFQAVEGCLMRSLEANNIVEAFPIHVGPPEASLSRSRNGVVYEFPVVRDKNKAWLRDGLPPFPPGSPVQLCTKDEDKRVTPIDLPLQGTPRIDAPGGVTLVECCGQGVSYRLALRFPTQIDIAKLPSDLIIRPDSPPPPETTQIKHLRQWCSSENRDHPVLRSIVLEEACSPPTIPLQFGDPDIAKYPRQTEAVRLAVSGGSFALIKGPPGTGKTRIITEIVRQLTKRRQTVLICSQTHQAVRNVLERLHWEGGFRMIRHAQPDDPKLSEIEKAYLGGGAEDAYFQNVVSHTQRNRDALQQQLIPLDKVLKAFQIALSAAEQLAEVRDRALKNIAEFTRQTEMEHRSADEILSRQLAESEATEKTRLRDIDKRRLTLNQKLGPMRAEILRVERKRVAAMDRFQKKTGQPPEVVHFGGGWRRWIRDACLPNWLIGLDALQERYSVATRRLEELRLREQTCIAQLDKIAKEDADTRNERTNSDNRLRAAHKSTRAASDQRHAEQCDEVRDKAREEEQRLRSIQAKSASFAIEGVSGLSDDASPDVWRTAINRISAVRQSTEDRLTFVSEWIKDIEAEPRAVTACYWDHLQVFFSTCVGIGSWRRLIERRRDAVDLVIIDEAAHATATETLIPLLYSKRAILIGDEMQLPPSMPSNIRDCSDECSQLVRTAIPVTEEPVRGIAGEVRMTPCWLGCSYFEWIWRARPGLPRTMLDTQFRMHPAIAEFVGTVFYPEGLHTGISAEDRQLGFGEFTRPICLIPTSAYKNRYEEFLDPGYRNALEAQAVRRVIEKAEAELKNPQEFGVITPYAEQKHLINRELADILPDLAKVRLTTDDVASVDSFQGSERDVIIVSFARSPKPCERCQGTGSYRERMCDPCRGKGWRGTGLTFARDLRRLNVAFSRARKMLVLIGDIQALADGRYRGGAPGGKVLNLFNKYVADRGKVLHLWERSHEYK